MVIFFIFDVQFVYFGWFSTIATLFTSWNLLQLNDIKQFHSEWSSIAPPFHHQPKTVKNIFLCMKSWFVTNLTSKNLIAILTSAFYSIYVPTNLKSQSFFVVFKGTALWLCLGSVSEDLIIVEMSMRFLLIWLKSWLFTNNDLSLV